MKKLNFKSEDQRLKLEEAFELVCSKMLKGIVPLTKENIMSEAEVCELLGVTDRTMRNYRQKKYIKCIKLDGRIIYLKHFLYLDLTERYYGGRKKE